MTTTNKNTMFSIVAVLAMTFIPTSRGFSPMMVPSITTRTTKTYHRPQQQLVVKMVVDSTKDDGSIKTIRTVPDGEAAASSASFSLDSIKELFSSVDLSSLNLDILRENAMKGEVGTRGEVYFAIQIFLFLCIAFGGVPVVGDTLTFLLGPGLLVAGVAVLVLGTVDLGDALSPWPIPTSKVGLKTAGIYAQMRHPMYAGTLAIAAGLSIVTGSANRLLLTAILWYLLEVKSDVEEKALAAQYPEYAKYKQDVPGKFVPTTVLAELPWNKERTSSED
jgi:protein-S-isoprenylcysteine O-methyltransferase Ste14